jgi:hypothetical protein
MKTWSHSIRHYFIQFLQKCTVCRRQTKGGYLLVHIILQLKIFIECLQTLHRQANQKDLNIADERENSLYCHIVELIGMFGKNKETSLIFFLTKDTPELAIG